jgi:hypothetical protein
MNKAVLTLALGATVLAIVFAPPEANEDVVAPVVRQPSPIANTSHNIASKGAASASMANKSAYPLQIIARQFDEESAPATSADANSAPATLSGQNSTNANLAGTWGGNLFANTNWTPPPPPAPVKIEKPPPPAPPSAPPLPFQFLGRWIEDGKVHFFLQMHDRNLSVQVGEEIGPYKFDSAQGGQLRFIYLPLQQVQTLAVGEIN